MTSQAGPRGRWAGESAVRDELSCLDPEVGPEVVPWEGARCRVWNWATPITEGDIYR